MNKAQWTLVGADSLASKELRDVIDERKLPVQLHLLSGDPDSTVLTADDEGEAAIMEPVTREALAGAEVVFLGGSPEQSRRTMEMAESAGLQPLFVDLSGELEHLPVARLRAPMVESELFAGEPGTVQVIAHPAAAVLARFLMLVHRRAPIRRTVATVCQPISAHGQRGIDEMHKQTVSLLSFQSMPKELFDAQVAFNLLPRFGTESHIKLAASAETIERHLVTLLAPTGVPLPSIRVIHAAVFHAYVFSIWVQFVQRPPVADLAAIFSSEGIDLRTSEVEPASNLGVAGQSGFTVDVIEDDHHSPDAAWFFLAADNLRTTAENAVMVAGLARPVAPRQVPK